MPEILSLLDLHRRENASIVRFGDMHLDAATTHEMFDDLLNFVDAEQPRVLILNFRHVRYFHSIVVGRLIDLQRSVVSTGGELRLCGLSPQATETLAITRVDRLFHISDAERAAIAAND